MVPDWICEVFSPSTAAHDRVVKQRLYAAQGVRHYWLVDVDARTLEALELSGGRWGLAGSYAEDAVVRVAPFGEIELAIGRLFLPVVASGAP